MKTKLMALTAVLLMAGTCRTDVRVNLHSATLQRWSGGVAGRSGQDYHIVLLTDLELEAEALYLKGRPCAYKAADGLRAQVKDGNIHVRLQVVRQEFYAQPLGEDIGAAAKKNSVCDSIPPFEGAALLVLKAGGRTFDFPVDSFVALPTLQYP